MGEHVTPLYVGYWLWAVWFVFWQLSAIITMVRRPTIARPPLMSQVVHLAPTGIGAFLLFAGSRSIAGMEIGGARLWTLPSPLGWAMTAAVAAGLIFTLFARAALGHLWSDVVGRKEDHALVVDGPYAVVRHPIYTGLIVAAFGLAFQMGGVVNLLGAAFAAFGLWLKAMLEERFLSKELGVEAYRAYRNRAPMLIPFWPRAWPS